MDYTAAVHNDRIDSLSLASRAANRDALILLNGLDVINHTASFLQPCHLGHDPLTQSFTASHTDLHATKAISDVCTKDASSGRAQDDVEQVESQDQSTASTIQPNDDMTNLHYRLATLIGDVQEIQQDIIDCIADCCLLYSYTSLIDRMHVSELELTTNDICEEISLCFHTAEELWAASSLRVVQEKRARMPKL